MRLGRFMLDKRLPVAAGLGGGSADAAAALRLLARANRLALDDPRLLAAARATGADVPVCLDPRPRMMRGIGEILSAPLDAAAAAGGAGQSAAWRCRPRTCSRRSISGPARRSWPSPRERNPAGRFEAASRVLAGRSNDLEAPAIALRR